MRECEVEHVAAKKTNAAFRSQWRPNKASGREYWTYIFQLQTQLCMNASGRAGRWIVR